MEWTALLRCFEERLESTEKQELGGSQMWRIFCLEKALELLEEDPDAALKHLEEFDRRAPLKEVAEALAKSGKQPDLKDIRVRFDNLGGGIV